MVNHGKVYALLIFSPHFPMATLTFFPLPGLLTFITILQKTAEARDLGYEAGCHL